MVAVWGTPIALEDDAERAVRAALDLVSAVALLGDDTDSGLQLRAAVSTGETAVTIGALGQGMVAGDVVNTTARMQTAAEPGSVLIDEATRRATEAAIAELPRRRLHAQRQSRTGRAVDRAAGGRRPRRRGPGRRTGAALRGPRPRVSADQGGRPGHRRGGPRAAGLDRRHRRDRQEPAGLGVREAQRRPRARDLVAPGALPQLRRRRRVLGAGRDGARACPNHGGRAGAEHGRQARGDGGAVCARRRGARLDHPRARQPAGTR